MPPLGSHQRSWPLQVGTDRCPRGVEFHRHSANSLTCRPYTDEQTLQTPSYALLKASFLELWTVPRTLE